MTSADKFNSGIQKWLDNLHKPWNRLRYTIIKRIWPVIFHYTP